MNSYNEMIPYTGARPMTYFILTIVSIIAALTLFILDITDLYEIDGSFYVHMIMAGTIFYQKYTLAKVANKLNKDGFIK